MSDGAFAGLFAFMGSIFLALIGLATTVVTRYQNRADAKELREEARAEALAIREEQQIIREEQKSTADAIAAEVKKVATAREADSLIAAEMAAGVKVIDKRTNSGERMLLETIAMLTADRAAKDGTAVNLKMAEAAQKRLEEHDVKEYGVVPVAEPTAESATVAKAADVVAVAVGEALRNVDINAESVQVQTRKIEVTDP